MDYDQFRTAFHEVLDVASVRGFFQFSVISYDDTFERDTDDVVVGDRASGGPRENGVSRACPACPERSRGKSVERVEAS